VLQSSSSCYPQQRKLLFDRHAHHAALLCALYEELVHRVAVPSWRRGSNMLHPAIAAAAGTTCSFSGVLLLLFGAVGFASSPLVHKQCCCCCTCMIGVMEIRRDAAVSQDPMAVKSLSEHKKCIRACGWSRLLVAVLLHE
jgi:hypothetical protein